MTKTQAGSLTTVPQIERRILVIRGQKVMIDADLAELYGVPTKALNQAVKRNVERFPADFMFQLSAAEKAEVVTNCDHLAKIKFSKALRRLMAAPAQAGERPIGFVTPQEKKGKR
jgi:hypothetical protein